MKKSDARNLLRAKLLPVINPAFKAKKSEFTFARTVDGLYQETTIAFYWSYAPDWVFSAIPSVTIYSIQKLYSEVFDDDSGMQTPTVSCSLWKMDGKPEHEFDVPLPHASPYFFTFCNEASLNVAIHEFRPIYHRCIEPFYEKVKSVEDAHRLLNVDILDTTQARMFRGLVAAYLADKPNWLNFAAKYSEALKAWPEFHQKRFHIAVERLKERDSP